MRHLAGSEGGKGSADGIGSEARFHSSIGIATDGTGTVYVADTGNSTIRKVTAAGVVTTLAGMAGTPGSADGTGDEARFNLPRGVAVDLTGALLVADTFNHTIRKVTPAGVVTTLAGQAGSEGSADGTGDAARFRFPMGIAVGTTGLIFVADWGNHTIRMVTPAGAVTTQAGLAGVPGSADGHGSARFNHPEGVTVVGPGRLFVADTLNHTVRMVSDEFGPGFPGTVWTLAGLAATPGSADGSADEARFNFPSAIVVGDRYALLVADRDNHAIRRVRVVELPLQNPYGEVTTFAGLPGAPGSADGTGTAARFSMPMGVTADATGTLHVADTGNATIRRATVAGDITTLAGLALASGSTDGVGGNARFSGPLGVAVDASGAVYVADTYNFTVRKITTDRVVTTLAGLAGEPGGADGTGSNARFDVPHGVAVDARGTVYVADTVGNKIRKVTANGVVTTLAGSFWPGSADGPGSQAGFSLPKGIAVDGAGTIYVVDSGNSTIRKITPEGNVTTLAGLAGNPGSADGTGAAARFDRPWGIAVDTTGTLYVADTENATIRTITPAGVVTTLAGQAGETGSADGTGSAARFNRPRGIGVDASGALYVADYESHVIRQVTRGGVVTTVAGLATARGNADGTGGAARFDHPCGVAVDASGVVYVADSSSHAIRVGLEDADEDSLPDPWERQWGLDASVATGDDGATGDPDHDGRTNAQERAAGTHPRGFHTAYLAEGANNTFFDMRLALLATGDPARALLRFQRNDGTTASEPLQVPAATRATLDVKSLPFLATAEFSTLVESDTPVVLDRTMWWSAAEAYGAHAETAVASPALTWYLAEGATHSGFDLFYLLQNPNEVEARVRVRFLRPSDAPLEKAYALPPNSRTNIWVDYEEFPDGSDNRALVSTDVSAVIEVLNGQPIVVERAMYSGAPKQSFGAGHESAGITAPAIDWFLAEGATGPFFDLFVLVANPGDADADVEATFLLPDGTTVVKRYTVAANSRFNIWVDYEDPRLVDTAVSTTIRSANAVPVIVERAMWWPGPTPASWYETHNSAGAATTGTRWALAEGEVDAARNFETYILVANTSAKPADVKVTLLFEDGTSAERTYAGIPARSRFNVPVGQDFGAAAGRKFGAIVESLGAPPAQIVVERAMYWDAGGEFWAAGTNALATRVQ